MLKNMKGLMLGRIIILTLLLSVSFIFQVSDKSFFFFPMTNNFYYFIGLFYLVTIFYSLFLKTVKNINRYAFVQIVIDHLFITVLIYFMGGRGSFFPILYIFSIIGSSMILYKRGAFWAASLASFLYGLLLVLQFYHWISPIGHAFTYDDASQIFYSLIVYIFTFYIIAFLSSVVSEELKRKKKELIQKEVDYNQLETFNRNIIQSLDSGLLTLDLSGKINFLNRTAEKILSRTREELIDHSIYNLIPNIGKMLEPVKKKSKASLTDYQRYETPMINPNGRRIYLGFSISPLTDPEEALIGHTLIFQDITRFKELEEQMKRVDKMAAIGSLAAGMAHEIRNPLASLSGSIQMLKADLILDEPHRHLMDITLRESERLNALITDFLLYAQPPQVRKNIFSIETILGETIDLLTHSPSYHAGIRIHKPNGHDTGMKVMADPDQLRQVFWNLLLNAAQAMVQGGEIRIQLKKKNIEKGDPLPSSLHARGKEWVKVSIADTGSGIASEEIDKIFEPFFTTKENGTGLGLSIVYKIVENHHGLIEVESELNKGSTFNIFLPYAS